MERVKGCFGNANPFKRRCSPSLICPLCNEHEESVKHVFLFCPWTIWVWFGGPLNYRVDRMVVTTLDAWILLVSKECPDNLDDKKFLLTIVAFTCWNIWKDRCKTIFNRKPSSPIQTINAVVCDVDVVLEGQLWFIPLRSQAFVLRCIGARGPLHPRI